MAEGNLAPVTVAVTAAAGSAGTLFNYPAQTSQFTIVNTDIRSGLEYRLPSASGWTYLGKGVGATLTADAKAGIYLRLVADGATSVPAEITGVQAANAAQVIGSTVAISGSPALGAFLFAASADGSAIDGPIQWRRGPYEIPGATGYLYQVTSADIGASLSVKYPGGVSDEVYVPTSIGYRISAGTLLDDYTTSYNQGQWVNSSSGGVGTAPTLANPRIVLTTGAAAAASNARIIHRSPSQGDTSVSISGITSSDAIVFDLEFPAGAGPEAGDSIQVILSSDLLSTKNVTLGYTFPRYIEGRIALVYPAIAPGLWSSLGGEVFDGTTFNYLSVRYSKAASSMAVAKQCIVHGFRRGTKARGKVTFEFDQGYSGVYQYALPALATRGIVGTVHVTRSAIGDAGSMTAAQLRELRGYGWEMSVRNGPQHSSFATLAALTAEMQAARQWNIDNGLGVPEHCIYPVGVMTGNSVPALIATGFKTSRMSSGGLACIDVGTPSPYNYLSFGLAGDDAGVIADGKKAIDDAEAFGKWARLYTHDIGPGTTPGGGGISQNAMNVLAAYAAERRDAGGIDVPTVSAVHSGSGR